MREPRTALAMATSARFFCAADASARTRAAARASRPMARIVASRFPALWSALSGAFMALIRLALCASYHVWRGPARRCAGRDCPQPSTAISVKPKNLEEPVSDASCCALRSSNAGGCNEFADRSSIKRPAEAFPRGFGLRGGGQGRRIRAFARVVALRDLARRATDRCRGQAGAAGIGPRAPSAASPGLRPSPKTAAKTARRRAKRIFALGKKICACRGEPPGSSDVECQAPGEAPQPLTLNHPASNPGRVSGRGSPFGNCIRKGPFPLGTRRQVGRWQYVS